MRPGDEDDASGRRGTVEGQAERASEDGARRAVASRMLAAVEPVSRAASAFVGFFGWMATLSLCSALVLSLWISLPFDSFATWKLAFALLTTSVLSIPGLVLALFREGLVQIVALPETLMSASSGLATSSRATYGALADTSGGRIARLLALVKSLATVRTVLLEGRNLLFGGAAVARVANPIVLAVVLGSLALSVLLVAVAAIVGATMVI